jgi:hypothetical protein
MRDVQASATQLREPGYIQKQPGGADGKGKRQQGDQDVSFGMPAQDQFSVQEGVLSGKFVNFGVSVNHCAHSIINLRSVVMLD